MKRWMVLASLLAVVPAAHAQYRDENVDLTGLSVRVGWVYPLEDGTRAVTGNMFGLALDVETPAVRLIPDSEGFLSFEWNGKSLDGGKGNFLSVMYNQRFTLGDPPPFTPRTYFFVGAGAVNVDVNKSGLEFGARVGAGYELNQNLFLEAAFVISSEADGARANNLAGYVGWRF